MLLLARRRAWAGYAAAAQFLNEKGRWVPRGDGLPASDAYLTILRQAFCHDGRDPLGLYFGATSGAVYGSADGGETWATMVDNLAPVYSVRCSS